jgi:DNA polymerase
MTNEEEFKKLEETIISCHKCNLWKSRKNPVVGYGSIDAEILFVGEAPGYYEDLKGFPFVGKAGKILDELLDSIGLKRDEVYIANILKCRPPKNRDPLITEIQSCKEHLEKQIELIQPKIIIPLGKFASSYILDKFGLGKENISKIHGKIFQKNTLIGQVNIIPMYHPAVATYNPKSKEILLSDFSILKRYISKIKNTMV